MKMTKYFFTFSIIYAIIIVVNKKEGIKMTRADCFFFKKMVEFIQYAIIVRNMTKIITLTNQIVSVVHFFSKEKAFDIIQAIVLRRIEEREEN